METQSSQTCSHTPGQPPDRPLKGEEEILVDQMLAALPRPEVLVQEVVTGQNFTGVIAGDRMGLASFLGARPKENEKDLAQTLVGKPVKEAADLVKQSSPWAISLGFAAMNAGNAPDPNRVEPDNFPAEDLIAELGKDKTVGLVGEFPFASALKQKVGTLHLFELKPVSGALARDQWEEVLPRLEILALTGTTLLTRHMAWYLSRATRAKIIILGPTTPASPTLFEFGADYLCGSVVTDTGRVSASIRADLCFKDIKKNGGIIFTRWKKTR